MRFEAISIDQFAEGVSGIYRDVELASDPSYKWMQIINDVTIVSEEIRRKRDDEAVDRLMKVLTRVVEFVGFYLSLDGDQPRTWPEYLAHHFRRPTHRDVLPGEQPREGISRWVLSKYPLSCSKCGARGERLLVGPCECLLRPWIFEERREKPKAFDDFRVRVKDNRDHLEERIAANASYFVGSEFSLVGLIRFFFDVYRNAYYVADPWRTAMHLIEEVGEVTAQLSRLNLLFVLGNGLRATDKIWDSIALDAIGRLEIHGAQLPEDKLRVLVDAEIAPLRAHEHPVDAIGALTAEKLKEELADVFSWIAALLVQLHDKRKPLEADAVTFLLIKPKNNQAYMRKIGAGGRFVFQCKWCGKESCSDACLVSNAVGAEVFEKIVKM